MATPKAKAGAGSGLYYGDGASPEVFHKLAQLLTLKKTGKKLNTEKVTNQDSPSDSNGLIYEEIIGTIAAGGTVDATLNAVWTDASQQALLALFDNQAHDFQIRAPQDKNASPVAPLASIAFSAMMLDYPDMDFPLDKAMTLTVKLTIIGPDTITFSEPA